MSSQKEALKAIALSIRALSMDGVQAANSGHPGLPMGCADLGALLYGSLLNINPKVPNWINRDRFILSAGHGSMFLYSLLHLSGFDLPLEELKNFRQMGSKTPGHPEFGHTPGVETTTGPLGAGFSNAVGMAMAESILAEEYNTDKHRIIDHYTYVLSGDGCLMEGVSAEAASLAGHLKLGKLIAFYDSNKITIEGSTDIAFTEDVGKRFEAYGWQVLKGSAHDLDGMAALVSKAKDETEKPSILILESTIGYGSPNKAGTSSVHGAPLGKDEILATRKNLGIPVDEDFYIAPEAAEYFAEKQKEWIKGYDLWTGTFEAWKKENADLHRSWEKRFTDPAKLVNETEWPEFSVGDSLATRKANGLAINAAAKGIPSFIGGSADLAPSNNTEIKDGGFFSAQNRAGRNINFGVREHAMGGVSNGICIHGGFTAFNATFLVFSDYMRPSVRLAALMKIPTIFVYTHDSIFVGEDGPTHQPIEQIQSLRNIPNLLVFRPADAEESIEAWKFALGHSSGPSALLFTRQNTEVMKKPDDWRDKFKKGAYTVKESDGSPEVVLVASGSELNLALEAAAQSKKKTRVVSMPCLDLFNQLSEEEQNDLIPKSSKVLAIEAGISDGWKALCANGGAVIGIDRFGVSGPGKEVAQELGLSLENILSKM